MIIGKPTDKCNVCGSRVREAREKLKLSQDQLAAKLQTEGLGVIKLNQPDRNWKTDSRRL